MKFDLTKQIIDLQYDMNQYLNPILEWYLY